MLRQLSPRADAACAQMLDSRPRHVAPSSGLHGGQYLKIKGRAKSLVNKRSRCRTRPVTKPCPLTFPARARMRSLATPCKLPARRQKQWLAEGPCRLLVVVRSSHLRGHRSVGRSARKRQQRRAVATLSGAMGTRPSWDSRAWGTSRGRRAHMGDRRLPAGVSSRDRRLAAGAPAGGDDHETRILHTAGWREAAG
jgi:hypothetical protein